MQLIGYISPVTSSTCIQMIHYKSQRGNDTVALNGYLFSNDTVNKNGAVAFRCVSKTCNSRGVESEGLADFNCQNEVIILQTFQ